MAGIEEIGGPVTLKSEYDKVIELLVSLSAFNVLTRQIVITIGHIFLLDTIIICSKLGITYKI